MGIGPGGLEPPFPDPKSGVLPLDEGPAVHGLQLRHITLRGQRLGGASRNSPCNGHVRASLERRPFHEARHFHGDPRLRGGWFSDRVRVGAPLRSWALPAGGPWWGG